jgi:hypothetical protein
MDSILDKILTQKHGQEIREFDPCGIVNSLLRQIPEREQEVVRRRFGFTESEELETLELIGAGLKVTRERIRQITKTALQKIKEASDQDNEVQRFLRVAEQLLGSYGGALSEDYCLQQFLEFSSINHQHPLRHKAERCLRFLLDEVLAEHIIRRPAGSGLKQTYALPSVDVGILSQVSQSLLAIIDNADEPLAIKDLVARFREQEIYKQNYEDLIRRPVEVARNFSDSGSEGDEPTTEEETKVVLAYAAMVADMDHNIFNQWGHSTWALIRPRRMNDKIFLILKNAGKPLHFNEITEQINQSKFDKKIAKPPSVHNELILDKRFVLVGRGLYALKDWGFEPGTVADVIVELLVEAKQPLSREEIVQRVLEKRLVKRQTIHLALMNKTKFEKLPDGSYRLVNREVEHGAD